MEIQREPEYARDEAGEKGGSYAFVCTGVGISAYIRERVPAQPTADALAERSCPPTSGSQSSLASIFLPPVKRARDVRVHKGNRCARRLHFASINIRSRPIVRFRPPSPARGPGERNETNMFGEEGRKRGKDAS